MTPSERLNAIHTSRAKRIELEPACKRRERRTVAAAVCKDMAAIAAIILFLVALGVIAGAMP